MLYSMMRKVMTMLKKSEELKACLLAAMQTYGINEDDVFYIDSTDGSHLNVFRKSGENMWRRLTAGDEHIVLFTDHCALGLPFGANDIQCQSSPLKSGSNKSWQGEWSNMSAIVEQWARDDMAPFFVRKSFPTNLKF